MIGRRSATAGLLFAACALAACGPRLDWREARSPDGAVFVLPGRAQTVTREVDAPAGRLTVTMTSAGVGASLFAVGSARLPSAAVADVAAAEKTLAYFRDTLVRNIGASSAARTPLAVPGAPRGGVGEEIAARGQAGPKGTPTQLAARLFIVDDRFFEVVAIFAEGEVTPTELETFFSSFRLPPAGQQPDRPRSTP